MPVLAAPIASPVPAVAVGPAVPVLAAPIASPVPAAAVEPAVPVLAAPIASPVPAAAVEPAMPVLAAPIASPVPAGWVAVAAPVLPAPAVPEPASPPRPAPAADGPATAPFAWPDAPTAPMWAEGPTAPIGPPISLVKPPPPPEPPPSDPEPDPERGPPPVPPPHRGLRFASLTSTIIALLCLGFLVQITLLGDLEHDRDQAQAFRELRIQLAIGTAPVGPAGDDGKALPGGTPVAILEIPKLQLQEVVFEGTTSRVMMMGPGHRRDSPLPGQSGTALILGRRGTYGRPFAELSTLAVGDPIVITTGQGRNTFTVIGLRHAGDPLPPTLAQGKGRVTLVTTDGPVYRPTDVLRVDADLTSDVQDRGPQVAPGSSPANEAFFSSDTSVLLDLMLWLPALTLAAIGVVWLSHRVGRWQAWVIGIPVLTLFGVIVIDDAAALLPNLL